MSTLWGEMPAAVNTETSGSNLEQEQISSKLCCVEVEGPALHQPSLRHFPPINEALPSEHFELDPLTHHTIQLVQYTRRMRNLINATRQQLHDIKNEEGEQLATFPPSPPIPVYDGPPLKHQVKKPLPFMAKDLDNPFVCGIGTPPPEIDTKINRKLLRKSVAAVCAHSGYDSCSDSILETLTDITHEYMLQITKQLRLAVDQEALTSNTGFPDVMERVFHEMGIGSTLAIHEFYQNRVILYHQHMIKKCQQLQQDYENMKNPDYKLEDARLARSKDEPFGDSSIHFPMLDSVDAEESGDTDSLQLESLGLDISQDHSTEEETRWHGRADNSESRVNSIDGFEGQDDGHSTGTDVPNTPAMSSEAGESIQDPGSVSGPDMISPPPSIGMRTSTNKPPKKKRKT